MQLLTKYNVVFAMLAKEITTTSSIILIGALSPNSPAKILLLYFLILSGRFNSSEMAYPTPVPSSTVIKISAALHLKQGHGKSILFFARITSGLDKSGGKNSCGYGLGDEATSSLPRSVFSALLSTHSTAISSPLLQSDNSVCVSGGGDGLDSCKINSVRATSAKGRLFVGGLLFDVSGLSNSNKKQSELNASSLVRKGNASTVKIHPRRGTVLTKFLLKPALSNLSRRSWINL